MLKCIYVCKKNHQFRQRCGCSVKTVLVFFVFCWIWLKLQFSSFLCVDWMWPTGILWEADHGNNNRVSIIKGERKDISQDALVFREPKPTGVRSLESRMDHLRVRIGYQWDMGDCWASDDLMLPSLPSLGAHFGCYLSCAHTSRYMLTQHCHSCIVFCTGSF